MPNGARVVKGTRGVGKRDTRKWRRGRSEVAKGIAQALVDRSIPLPKAGGAICMMPLAALQLVQAMVRPLTARQ